MARIDMYLGSVVKFGANGMLLKAGDKILLRLPAGDRYATQTVGQQDLVAMVNEIAPPETMADLEGGVAAALIYPFGDAEFTITVTPEAQGWEVEIALGAADEVIVPTDVMEVNRQEGEAEAPAEEEEAQEPVVGFDKAPIPPPIAKFEAAKQQATLVEKLMIRMKELDASDLHLCTGSRPLVRHSGNVSEIVDFPVFDAETLEKELMLITPEENQAQFREVWDTDFAHQIKGVSRFRANLFMDRMGPGAVFRTIPFEILSSEKLGIPSKVLDLCYLTKGLVLVTGPTGSGKSTTLASLIDHINRNRADHIITIEDPVEFVHPNKKCLVNQREIGTHTKSFKSALRAALREDPDIVLVGEMRDLETIEIAVETAETGHLVFGTLHTTTAPGTIDRIIDQFPTDRQEQIRQMLSESLKGVIAQVLCKKIGGGRVAALEILLANNAVSNLIRERKTFQLFSLMQTQRGAGMMTLNDCLIGHVKNGLVDPMEAYMKSANKQEMTNLLAREGHQLSMQGEGEAK